MKYELRDTQTHPLFIENDPALELDACTAIFEAPITIKNCTINFFDFFAVYYIDGLILENCVFNCEFIGVYGAHNTKPVIIKNCTFKEFVDLEDCIFEEDLIFENVNFIKGTNLFGNIDTPFEISFKKEPKLTNVKGKLDVNTFGKDKKAESQDPLNND